MTEPLARAHARALGPRLRDRRYVVCAAGEWLVEEEELLGCQGK